MQSRLLLRRSLLTSVIRRWAQLDSASTVKSTKFSETPAFKKYKSGMTSIGTGGSKSYSGWSAYSDINRYSVAFSVFVFLIYFGILREENDIDEGLYEPLYKKLPKLEMDNLKTLITAGKAKHQDVSEYEKRLRELESETKMI